MVITIYNPTKTENVVREEKHTVRLKHFGIFCCGFYFYSCYLYVYI